MGAKSLFMAEGGEVPGTGTGDTVPAMLTPGEIVLNKAQQANVAGAIKGSDMAETNSLMKQQLTESKLLREQNQVLMRKLTLSVDNMKMA